MSLTLGPVTLQEIPGNLMVATTGGDASTDMSGTIGEGILKRFTTTYDYARGVVYLEPNAEFAKPFPGRKTFGVTLLSDGPDYRVFRVTAVRKDSPAEAAGLKKDDVVVALDGKPASEFRLADLRQALSADGSQHTLTIRRGDDSILVAVTVSLVSLDDR
jgi:C-terminal processing protease CtpA/Prc